MILIYTNIINNIMEKSDVENIASFVCPISQEMMEDPVIDPTCGVTYDRKSIVGWLNECIANNRPTTSPNSRKPLTESMLIPNRALADTIAEFKKKNSGAQNSVINDNANSKFEFICNTLDVDAKKLEPESSDLTMFRIKSPKDLTIRAPLNICCVIDVSGSMANEAQIKDGTTEQSRYGFSLLDIVKHAVLTIVESLGSNDYFSLISFSTNAAIHLIPTKMSSASKMLVKQEIEKLTPDGKTNLWDGLVKAFAVLNKFNETNGYKFGNSHILLLTDGEPNIDPPSGKGYIRSLQLCKKMFGGYPAAVHTFGFGYSLDSALLNEISQECVGSFSFIPDASFVGTIFINLVANLMTTVVNKLVMTMELSSVNIKKLNTIIPHKHYIDGERLVVEMGSMTIDQDQYVVLPCDFKSDNTIEIWLAYYLLGHDNRIISQHTISNKTNSDNHIVPQKFRFETVTKILEAYNYCVIGDYDGAQNIISDLVKFAENLSTLENSHVNALMQDLKGQVTEAINSVYFNKWGRHYLLSLLNAHAKLLCNNFKDPGVQLYGGIQFREIRDQINVLFDALPPPKPSLVNMYSASSYVSISSMQSYNNSSAPCFHPSALVKLYNGEIMPITLLRKGDLVCTDNGSSARVLCVIKYICNSPTTEFVNLNGLLITPWHPVRSNGQFVFPNKLGPVITIPCTEVYNVVLETDHIIILNNIECVTLGHSFTQGDANHPYFGNNKQIVSDLSCFTGWVNGFIQMEISNIHRNLVTGLVDCFK
ncbi:hypothetical protein QJ857_gp1303 [Tupanvirus soda lake]|uniref:Uncharacterized protein n=2 Tax=Tupanvirus TaxID=2094720 RepID=A0A6N1NIG2_9VIRU|nr:hypothetical protein QJ857_gp1303 [Tupanvirus soda lake]QKU34759.1 hypothetical protein [Tupanvirus soda lake]